MEKAAVTERNLELEKKLAAELGGRPVRAFWMVSSTMEEAHRWAADGAPEGALVFAERQEQGRGRLGRTWDSPAGGIYLSLILRPNQAGGSRLARPGTPGRAGEARGNSGSSLEPTASNIERSSVERRIPQLSLVAGLAAAEAVRECSGLFPSIRWPNDLLIGGKKVAGILAEARWYVPRASVDRQLYAVVGIGINVTTKLKDLPGTATSLLAHLPADSTFDIRHSTFPYQFTGELHRGFQRWYDKWIAEGFAPIREALRPWIGLFGHPVHVTAGTNRFEGTAADLDESGRLIVRLDSGIMRPFEMGEVALLR